MFTHRIALGTSQQPWSMVEIVELLTEYTPLYRQPCYAAAAPGGSAQLLGDHNDHTDASDDEGDPDKAGSNDYDPDV